MGLKWPFLSFPLVCFSCFFFFFFFYLHLIFSLFSPLSYLARAAFLKTTPTHLFSSVLPRHSCQHAAYMYKDPLLVKTRWLALMNAQILRSVSLLRETCEIPRTALWHKHCNNGENNNNNNNRGGSCKDVSLEDLLFAPLSALLHQNEESHLKTAGCNLRGNQRAARAVRMWQCNLLVFMAQTMLTGS